MYAGVRTAAVYNPESLAELAVLRSRFPHALLWAGGTDIMRRVRPYPAADGIDIIYLGNVQELQRISRSERYLEIGAMVTIEQLLRVGQHILNPILSQACRQSGTYLVRSQATIGGVLGISDISMNIPTALSILESLVEIRNPVGRSNASQWIPVHRLFSFNRERTALQSSIITRLRIQLENGDFEFFRTVGEPYLQPDTSVIISVFARYNRPVISEYRLAITFPQSGIFKSREIETAVSGMDLPFEQKDVKRIISLMKEDLRESPLKSSELQIERASRVLEMSLHQMNRSSTER